MKHTCKSNFKLALISPPWPLFDRPSIQLGALKSYLESRLPCLSVATHHAYLAIANALGYDIYRHITS